MADLIKYPIEISQTLIDFAFTANLLCASRLEIGKYVCVEVTNDGYSLPHTASVIDDLEYAEKACNAHNKYLGFTKEEADKIIYQSMNNSLN